jgi:hypothetical protein
MPETSSNEILQDCERFHALTIAPLQGAFFLVCYRCQEIDSSLCNSLMTNFKATPEQWAQCEDWVKSSVVGASDACILELRARVEALEAAAHKHIVETNSNIVALFIRVESLEAAERQASKVYQISKPLKLTSKQQEELNALLQSNSQPLPNPSQIRSSLVERVRDAVLNNRDGNDYVDEARAAIREVAAWMTSNPDVYFPPALVFALEREAEL